MCDRHLNGGVLVCVVTSEHDPGHGCTYEATWAPDGRHDDAGTAP